MERLHQPLCPSGYTASELSDAITEATADVKSQDLSLRRLKNELETMKSTQSSGTIVSKVSGTITKLQDKDNINYNMPFMVVTGSDEFYIEGAIGEFDFENVNVGDTVSVMSWESGNSCEATIESIDTTPTTDNGFYSSGNSNVSSYSFRASIDANSGISVGETVDLTIDSGSVESGIYIYSALIREDSSGSYVMKMDASNRLQKQYVSVGKNLYGYYTEIKDGVTMDDYLAFPYGNGSIEGIQCEIVDSLESY